LRNRLVRGAHRRALGVELRIVLIGTHQRRFDRLGATRIDESESKRKRRDPPDRFQTIDQTHSIHSAGRPPDRL
jgi:hypothetical protein